MKDVILKVENISKQYRLGVVGTGTLSHDLNRWWHKIRGKEDPYLKVGEANDRTSKGNSEYVWALQDINFEVERGEVLGIIGKNGAGKSTLLKILSKVTAPTTGVIKSRGRIASLLEVGTGFNPELTGRENIYLNGAILGMTKKEIASKIDEIIEFSGCERYIDTPTKRYSSGMTVRLAFAVAAFLEPEILVVDEVLAVGDAEFQKKAIGKMQDISKSEGRTVLFVSHNMAAVRSLCTQGIVLEHGKVVFEGESNDAVDYYLEKSSSLSNSHLADRLDRKGNGKVKFVNAFFVNKHGKVVNELVSGDYAELIVEYEKKDDDINDGIFFGITFYDSNEVPLTILANDELGVEIKLKDKIGRFKVCIPEVVLRGGVYNLKLFISVKKNRASENVVLDLVENALNINIQKGDYWKTGVVNRPNGFVLNASLTHEEV